MNNVLILGGSGLLGQSLVQYFINHNFQVGALSRHCKSKNNRFINYAVDVLNYEKLELVVSQYDFVINCIGQITNPIHECVSINTKGITNIVEAVKKNGNYLIHLSTVSVYGSSSTVTEAFLLRWMTARIFSSSLMYFICFWGDLLLSPL